MIPRASSVLVKRLPAAPGKGTAQRYVASLNNTKDEKVIAVNPGIAAKKYAAVADSRYSNQPMARTPQSSSEDELDVNSEEAKIQAMFRQEDEHWQQEQQRMAE
jgi:hypothetical protein